VPVSSVIRRTAAEVAIRHMNPPRISARRRVARSARRPAQSMNETPDTSSMSLAPRSRMIHSRPCCSRASVQTTRAEANQIVLRIDPDPGLRLQLSALGGQSWRTVHLDTSFARELGEPPEPYEVLHAAMVGDHQYFAREDSVEETWRIVQPLLDHPLHVRPYPRGSWGPEEAETMLRGHPRWQQPWLPEEG
jgi:glucose-6-phosphate dehydrogenase-like protein